MTAAKPEEIVSPPLGRLEDERFLKGTGHYAADDAADGRLVARFFRSSVAHGRIRVLDVTGARAARGVVAVLTASDVAQILKGESPVLENIRNRDGSTTPVATRPALARDRVRFVGEPIAVIVAVDDSAASDAAELITIEIDDLTPVTELSGTGPDLHPDVPRNIGFDWSAGDEATVEAAFAAADHSVELDLRIPRIHGAPIEPISAEARYDQERGRWTLIAPTQGVHAFRRELAQFFLGVPEEAIRIVTPDVGGGFGIRIHALPEHAVLLAVAKILGRPVTWRSERMESMLAEPHSRDHAIRASLALSKDGLMLALRAHSRCNLGAYVHPGSRSTPTGGLAFGIAGPYRLPAMELRVEGIYTSTVPTAPFRGAGQPEGAFVIERLLDVSASRLGLSPVEIRRRNLLRSADFPYASATGSKLDSGDPLQLLESALKRVPQPAQSGAALRGRGIAMYQKINGMGRREQARIEAHDDGRVLVRIGSQSNGQGHETTFARLLAEALRLPLNRIRVIQGDSDEVESGTGTGASSALGTTGSSIVLGAETLIRQGCAAAAEILEAAVVDISYDGGRFIVPGTDRALTLSELAAHLGRPLVAASEVGITNTFTFGCHLCDVVVDPETGSVEVESYHSVEDLGRVVNFPVAQGQIHGGIAQGVGQALLEHLHYDRNTGQALAVSFFDYGMPRADTLSNLSSEFGGIEGTTNPLGVRGAGEAGATGSMAAVVNAVHDALRSHGIENIDPPLTSFTVWRALAIAAER